MDWGNLNGLVLILVAVYFMLMAKGILPRSPRDPEKMELWRRKFGPMLMVIGPILIIFGVLQLFGIFPRR